MRESSSLTSESERKLDDVKEYSNDIEGCSDEEETGDKFPANANWKGLNCRKYSIGFKLQVVALAKMTSTTAAHDKFNIDRKSSGTALCFHHRRIGSGSSRTEG